MKNKKIKPWRVVAFALSAVFIVYMWVSKDIAAIYQTMPQEHITPMIITTVLVSLLKAAGFVAAVFLFKCTVGKIKKATRRIRNEAFT